MLLVSPQDSRDSASDSAQTAAIVNMAAASAATRSSAQTAILAPDVVAAAASQPLMAQMNENAE